MVALVEEVEEGVAKVVEVGKEVGKVDEEKSNKYSMTMMTMTTTLKLLLLLRTNTMVYHYQIIV